MPTDRLLDLTGVRFVITDKQRDLWADDVYYDLELAARLDPSRDLNLDLSAYPPFEATALGVVVEAASDAQDRTSRVELIVVSKDGRTEDPQPGGCWPRNERHTCTGAPAPGRPADAGLAHRTRAGRGAGNPPARHQPHR